MNTRNCPQCGNEIVHTTSAERNRSAKKGAVCRKCVGDNRKLRELKDEYLCAKCNTVKPVSEFSSHANRPNGLQSRCKSCSNKAGLDNYYKNKDRYYAVAKNRQEWLRSKVREAKSVPCADCAQSFDPVCMDFDHLPEFIKEYDISYMVRHRMAWSRIEAEISKCEVVCANCHRLRSKDRLTI